MCVNPPASAHGCLSCLLHALRSLTTHALKSHTCTFATLPCCRRFTSPWSPRFGFLFLSVSHPHSDVRGHRHAPASCGCVAGQIKHETAARFLGLLCGPWGKFWACALLFARPLGFLRHHPPALSPFVVTFCLTLTRPSRFAVASDTGWAQSARSPDESSPRSNSHPPFILPYSCTSCPDLACHRVFRHLRADRARPHFFSSIGQQTDTCDTAEPRILTSFLLRESITSGDRTAKLFYFVLFDKKKNQDRKS